MAIKASRSEAGTELAVSGELDMHSSPALRKVLLELVAKQTPHVVINLAEVPYVDSSGLATLVECMQGVARYKGRLQLTGVHQRIWPVFELARLDKVFDIRRQSAGE